MGAVKAWIWLLTAAIGAVASIFSGLTGPEPTMWSYPAVGLALVVPLALAIAETRPASALWLVRTFSGLAPRLRLVAGIYAVAAIGWFWTVPRLRTDWTLVLAAVTAVALLAIAALGPRLGIEPASPQSAPDARAAATTVGTRLRATRKRSRVAFVGGVLAVVAVVAVALWQLSPTTRAEAGIAKLLNRELPSDIAGSAVLAGEIGLDRAPAGITFKMDGWSTKDGAKPGSFSATWKLVAQGANGKRVVSDAQGATFANGPDGLVWTSFLGSPPDFSDLVGAVPDQAAAKKLVDDTNQADKALGVIASLREATEPDPAGAAVDPAYIDNPQWLKADTRTKDPGKEAQLQVTYLDVGDATYRVLAVPADAVPATIERGTLEASDLAKSAAATLAAIGAARTSGNVGGLADQLANAGGLDPSGLAAAVIEAPAADSLQVTGQFGDYRTSTSSGLALQFRDGRWVLDYTGQPLGVLVAQDAVTYEGHTSKTTDYYGVTTTYYDVAPVRVSLTPTVVRSGDSAFRLDLAWTRPQLKKYEIGGYYGGGSGSIWIRDLQVNGASHPVPPFECSFSGPFTLDRTHCLTADMALPAGGLQKIDLTIDIGTQTGSSEYVKNGLLTATPMAPSADSAAAGAVLLAAKEERFNPSESRAPAAAPFALRFVNLDAATSYKVRIVNESEAVVWEGDPADAGEHLYQVPPLAAGNYRIRCSYHPNMEAALVVGPVAVAQQ